MKLADLLSDMIEAGASMDAVKAVVVAARHQDDASEQKRREQTAARVRAHRERKRAGVTLVTQETPVTRYPPIEDNHTPKTSLRSEKQTSRAKPKSQIAEDAQPETVDRQVATEAGMDPATFRGEWGLFRDHHLKVGSLMSDWRAAWRTWVGNWVKWGCKQHTSPASVVPAAHGARAGPFDRSDSIQSGQAYLARKRAEREQATRHSPDWNGPEIELAAVALPYR